MGNPFFRYFLAFWPDASTRALLAAIAKQLGQSTRPDLLHLTLCVIKEVVERDPFLAARIAAALTGHSLSSVPVRLGRVKAGELGPMATRHFSASSQVRPASSCHAWVHATRIRPVPHRRRMAAPRASSDRKPCRRRSSSGSRPLAAPAAASRYLAV